MQDGVEGGREVVAQGVQVGWGLLHMLHHHLGQAAGREWGLPGEHLEQHTGQRIQIALRHGLAVGLLWRDVGRGTGQRGGSGELGGVDYAGDAKVGQHRGAILPKENIGGFDIAVNDALAMRVIERAADSGEDAGDFGKGQWTDGSGQRAESRRLLTTLCFLPAIHCSQLVLQRPPRHILHHHVGALFAQTKIVSLHDMGMDHAGDSVRFGGKAALEVVRAGQCRCDQFDRDIATQIGIACAIHLGHAPTAQ